MSLDSVRSTSFRTVPRMEDKESEIEGKKDIFKRFFNSKLTDNEVTRFAHQVITESSISSEQLTGSGTSASGGMGGQLGGYDEI